jgi:hypothetical protein
MLGGTFVSVAIFFFFDLIFPQVSLFDGPRVHGN